MVCNPFRLDPRLPSTRALVLTASFGLSAVLVGQTPVSLGDLNATPAPPRDSWPGNGSFMFRGATYFMAGNPSTGRECYRTDGTLAGTSLLADIGPGSADFRAGFGQGGVGTSRVYFFARPVGTLLEELWSTDGTAAGTALVKVLPDPTAYANLLVATLQDTFLFERSDTTSRTLWVSDGTDPGTTVLLQTPTGSSWVPTGKVLGSQLIFHWSDPQHGQELWTSDGTSAGTHLLVDINPGTSGSAPQGFVLWGSQLAFSATDGATGRELWLTDGTAAGTRVIDAVPGAAGVSPDWLLPFGNQLLFQGRDAAHGAELWTSDGTAAGTHLLDDVRPGSASSFASPLGSAPGYAVFLADDGVSGREPWVTDGVSGHAAMLMDISPGIAGSGMQEATTIGNRVAFRSGGQLVVTDGTSAGTRVFPPVAERELSILGSLPNGNVLLRTRDNVVGLEPFTFDGVSLSLLSNISPEPAGATNDVTSYLYMYPIEHRIVPINDGVHGVELWHTDGTAAGTGLIADINPGSASSVWQVSLPLRDGVLLIADDGAHGPEPWITDGSVAGTRMIADILPGASGSVPISGSTIGARLRGKAIFGANDGSHGIQPWVTDGTTAGTFRLGNPPPGCFGFERIGAQVYFQASNQLWRTDGTAAGTTQIPFGGSNPREFTAFRDRVYFAATTPAEGSELWTTDGTAAGTHLVADVVPGNGSSYPTSLTVWDSRLWFTTVDAVGTELWSTDGTTAGTLHAADLGDSSPYQVTATPHGLYFAAGPSATGRDLYRVAPGTTTPVMVKDIWPGPLSAEVQGLYSSGSRYLWFQAADPVAGAELWRTDGTALGTVRMTDLWPGPAGAGAYVIGTVGGSLLFRGNDGVTGVEHWVLDPGAMTTVLGIPCGLGFHEPRLDVEDPVLGAVITASVSNVTPSSPGLLLFGLPGPAVSIGNGCDLHLAVPTVVTAFATDATGHWSVPLQVPRDPVLRGLRAAFQAAVAAQPGLDGLETTPATVLTFGL